MGLLAGDQYTLRRSCSYIMWEWGDSVPPKGHKSARKHVTMPLANTATSTIQGSGWEGTHNLHNVEDLWGEQQCYIQHGSLDWLVIK